MKMAVREVHSWTLVGLVGAFIDLGIAYFLLCVSAFAFLPLKVLTLLGIFVPCPCSGFFEYQNDNLCFRQLLSDWPRTLIICVQQLAKSRFPFDLIWSSDHSMNSHGGDHVIGDVSCENGTMELEGKAGSTSRSLFDRESRCDGKGKRTNQNKQKSGIWRRRRAAFGRGKFRSNGMNSVGTDAPSDHTVDGEIRSEISEICDHQSGVEDGFMDVGNAPNGIGFSDRIQHSLEIGGSSSIKSCIYSAKDLQESNGIVANHMRMLEQALEEEKAAHAAVYQELEEERAAAATAADEALAMILRLQEDRASIAMDVRQYQRMIDEKFSYDEEEMSILTEILVRREKENHYLEKELESYRQMNVLRNEQIEVESGDKMNSIRQRVGFPVDTINNPICIVQQIDKTQSMGEKEAVTIANLPLNHGNSNAFGKEMASEHEKLDSHLSTSQGLLQKIVDTLETESTRSDQRITSQVMRVPQTCGDFREEPEKEENHQNQGGSTTENCISDTESTVYDVHVVDDKTTHQKENDAEENEQLTRTATMGSVILSTKAMTDSQSESTAATEPSVCGSTLDMSSRLTELNNVEWETLGIDSWRNPLSGADSERLQIYTEVERLRERLRTVQEGKEKLTFSPEQREVINAQLKLVEEIVNQLQEIHQLREPTRSSSLPPSSSKVNSKKIHSRSASLEAFETAQNHV